MRCTVQTPWGTAGIEASDTAIVRFHLPGQVPDDFTADGPPSDLLLDAAKQAAEYFDGTRESFSLPLEPGGDGFPQSVWRELLRIPFGELRTYGDIAKALGKPGASRAVGKACGANPIPLFIPCHRVVGAGNRLVGFSGGGVEVKKRLIEHEMGGLFARKRRQG